MSRRIQISYDDPVIFIHSKHPLRTRTAELLYGLNYRIVCAPVDIPGHTSRFGPARLVVLPRNEMTEQEVENHIMDLAIKKQMKWIWIMRDDIESFTERYDGHVGVVGFKRIKMQMERVMRRSKLFAMASLSYYEVMKQSTSDKIYNSYCRGVKLINLDIVKKHLSKFDTRISRYEDDFVLELLLRGENTVRFGQFGYQAPTRYFLGPMDLEHKWQPHHLIADTNGRYHVDWSKHQKRVR